MWLLRLKKAQAEAIREACLKKGLKLFEETHLNRGNKNILKIFCALLYWREGGKYDDRSIQFTNSDSKLVNAFLNLLRNSFSLNESKLRIFLHIHSYHSVRKQIKFWSSVTKVPPLQFIKPYIKSNTGKRIKFDYLGCINVKLL